MAVPNVRGQVIQKLDELTDEEVVAILEYMESLHPGLEQNEQIDDPTVGMFSGPTDLSVRAKDILRDEITARSGWTQKKD
jgi:hypothetical protein